MMKLFLTEASEATPITLLSAKTLPAFQATLTPAQAQWLNSAGFTAKRGTLVLLPDVDGHLASVCCGVVDFADTDSWLKIVVSLPEGEYQLVKPSEIDDQQWFYLHLHWAMAQYQFTRYRPSITQVDKSLLVPADLEESVLVDWYTSLCRARDLINTPCEDCFPQTLAAVCEELARQFDATVNVIEGDDLLEHGFPTVHRVGRAGGHAPCFIELKWGDPQHPKVCLLGKGVCFDTGGLDIKPASGMRQMKKDMGGAACAIALSEMIMRRQLPIQLNLLIPAVENNVSANAMMPGDVVTTREGITVEISNTDAEGRLILCDALSYAVEQQPVQIIDFATLTGAARVALGPDLPALFANSDDMADQLIASADRVGCPIWRLPLHSAYHRYLKSDVADMMNSSATGFAGAITAALYLQRFVPDDVSWAHFDVFGWNPEARPGRPKGGEAGVVLGVFDYLETLVKGS